METETLSNYSFMGRTLSELSQNDNSAISSAAFSDCNSDRSCEFPTSQTSQRRLLLACAEHDNEHLITQLITNLSSNSPELQKQSVMEIRLLAKNKPETRLNIAKAGAIPPLIQLISSTADPIIQEHGVTGLLNLSLCDENKHVIASSGGISPLVHVLKTGTSTSKENAACALLRLSQVEEHRVMIGRSGAVPLLVNLLETGGLRGKKDACTALYSLCSGVKENKVRAIEGGIMRVLVELMADFGSGMVDKAAYVVGVLVGVKEGRVAFVDEGGIPVMVEVVEVGTQRQKEIAVGILLQVCVDCLAYRVLVGREGAIPPLVDLSQSGTAKAKQKAETLIELLRQPRSGKLAARPSDVST